MSTNRRRRWPWVTLGILAILTLTATVAVQANLPAPATALADAPRGTFAAGVTGSYALGDFAVTIDAEGLVVTHPNAAGDVWRTPRREAFLTAAVGAAEYEDDFGLLRIAETLDTEWAEQTLDAVAASREAVTLAGELHARSGDAEPLRWEATLEVLAPARLGIRVAAHGPGVAPTRLFLRAALDDDESVHGFGGQSAGFDLRGTRVPIVSREQGVGRGEQPLSLMVDLVQDAAGGQDTTYLVSATHVTSHSRSLVYTGERISAADLRGDDLVWEVWDAEAEFSAVAAATPREAIALQSEWTGAAAPPPAWTQEGLIVGLQGGTEVVREKIRVLREAGVPLAGVWLQDWSGKRVTSFGDRLQWNWQLNSEQYPGWAELVAELAEDGIRTLSYTNAFLSADSGAAAAARGGRDLHAEAAALGYLVKDADGAVMSLDQHGFFASMVDLTNEDAAEWFAAVIAEELAGVGASGWMADFAEGPPPSAVLAAGSGEQWRAAWPVLWQRVNERALELAGLGEEGFVFHRSSHTASAGVGDALWLGDQLQNWAAEDGLGSVITLLQSASASGLAQMHSDVGGYTSLALPVVPDIARDGELLVRWAEASVLGPVLRSHEGNRPAMVAQAASDPALAAQLADTVRLFVALAPERARLSAADPLGAAQQHPWMLFPDQTALVGSADHELMLGPDVLLAPALSPGVTEVRAVLPPGRWQHVWSGEVFGAADAVASVTVPAPLGQPALFVRDGTAVARELAAFAAG